MQASASASATATAAPRAAGGPAAGRGAPMQAAAAPRAPSPASATQAFTADGDANATTSAPRAAASASAGSAATGSVLYVLRRTTSAPRAARPACRTQCPRPQTLTRSPHATCSRQSCMAPSGAACRAAWRGFRLPLSQHAPGSPGASGGRGRGCAGRACRSEPALEEAEYSTRGAGAPSQSGSSAARCTALPARGRTHVSAGPRGSHHGVLGVQLCTA